MFTYGTAPLRDNEEQNRISAHLRGRAGENMGCRTPTRWAGWGIMEAAGTWAYGDRVVRLQGGRRRREEGEVAEVGDAEGGGGGPRARSHSL